MTRFFALRTNFHIIDNNSISKENKDKFIKVRPLFDAVLKKCNSLPLEQDLCVDEQMVPFKGQLSIKQYMKGKPIKWGVNIFLLCGGKSGMAYNFMLFQEYSELDSNLVKSVGSGGSVVLHLTQNVPPNRHFLYFDNYFSSFGLFERLQQLNIYAVGTIRSNWFAQPPFLSDKQMRKMGRGTAFEVTTDMNHCNIGLVKWFDNKAVTLGFNYVTSGDVDKVERWDKKKKAYVEIERPEIVRKYNESMGGVDKMDQLISYYRILIRSRKWTLRMAMHAFDIAITNSWIQYTKEAEQLNIPKKNVLDLLHFRINLAKDLITFEKPITLKRKGRPLSTPSNESVNEPSQTYKIPKVDSQRPTDAVRTDTIDHLPEFDDRKYATKCKNKKCEGRRTHVYCLKCNVHLCLDKKK
ncbi:piggyBac transposable element-derived protein 3-like [Melanaphis sacchari]|uniref:piggyBac transposable element-derived protein 3-like n=1 Tax=Melanaphis sacchari TaxID=742174 RepID=UPI000DC1480A|nr:piggyBac transposable element-derived protein 3-like [Melanaphis sacchari]